jgi:hypothetical protein
MIVVPPIPDEVVAVVAANPAGLTSSVREALGSHDSRVVRAFEAYLAALPEDAVSATLKDPQFCFFASRAADQDQEARIWLTERALQMEIPRRRVCRLRSQAMESRPTPYDIPALSDAPVDSEHLVPLTAFTYDGSRLCRNDFAFLALCTAKSPNSTYWLLTALYEAGVAERTSVRLDPFLWGPADVFPAMFYKMWVYGQPMDWDRLERLTAPEHGRWFPGPLSHESAFTDFVWSPRGPEVHFIAEEVPRLDDAETDGARYLHAVYQPRTRTISHLDGAVRVYTRDELERRHSTHVRQAGKAGLREKVFRLDAPIPRETLSTIVQAFYVWNQDVVEYFTVTVGIQ